jgi:hypothetical protein
MGIRRLTPQIITPSTADKIIKSDLQTVVKVLGDPDLVAGNILENKDIFGILGSVIAGKKWAKGSVTDNSTRVSIGGLSFSPRTVLLIVGSVTANHYSIYYSADANLTLKDVWQNFIKTSYDAAGSTADGVSFNNGTYRDADALIINTDGFSYEGFNTATTCYWFCCE